MTTLKELTDALKYLGRLDKFAFKMLLFPDATEDYLDDKWSSFQASLVSFLWSCSSDKLDLITGWLSINHDVDLFTSTMKEIQCQGEGCGEKAGLFQEMVYYCCYSCGWAGREE